MKIAVCFGILFLIGIVNATTTLTLSNSITPNSIDLIRGSASDNALITASCTGGDTCQIWKVGGTSSLASGTTTASLVYSTLPLGYTGIYANDISGHTTSSTDWVRRINEVH